MPRSRCDRDRGAHLGKILDLFAEDNRLNIYAGELEVRPPGAPTTEGGFRSRENRHQMRSLISARLGVWQVGAALSVCGR